MGLVDRVYSHLREELSTYAVGAACAGVIYFCGYMASRGSEKTINRPVIEESRNNKKSLEIKVKKDGETGKLNNIGIQGEPAFIIMEYSDRDCPFCMKAFTKEQVEKALEKYDKK